MTKYRKGSVLTDNKGNKCIVKTITIDDDGAEIYILHMIKQTWNRQTILTSLKEEGVVADKEVIDNFIEESKQDFPCTVYLIDNDPEIRLDITLILKKL